MLIGTGMWIGNGIGLGLSGLGLAIPDRFIGDGGAWRGGCGHRGGVT